MDMMEMTGQQTFDSRDVQERIEELEEIAIPDPLNPEDDSTLADLDDAGLAKAIRSLQDREQLDSIDEEAGLGVPLSSDEEEKLESMRELQALRSFRDDCRSSEWKYGVAFIADHYWNDYAEEMAYDIGMIERDSQISGYIDWEKWANDVQMDYSSVELDGHEFWYRS